MKTSTKFVLFTAVAALLPGCDIFEEQSADFMSFQMDGEAGEVVTVVYSKQFIAAVDEVGITHVEIFGADTVMQTLPIDTIIDIRVERQMYIEALTEPTDTVEVDVQVDVNDRGVFTGSGSLFPGVPWRLLYRFNQRITQNIEIVI